MSFSVGNLQILYMNVFMQLELLLKEWWYACVWQSHTSTGLLGWNIYKKVNDAVVMHLWSHVVW
jgi:hypothetical protein